jgi:hypothetical protein
MGLRGGLWLAPSDDSKDGPSFHHFGELHPPVW